MNIMNLSRYMKNIKRIGEAATPLIKKINLVFFRLKLLVLSNNNVFSNNNISIKIYR